MLLLQATQLPQGFWARLNYIWERPVVKSIRITASIANWSVRLPAIAALLLAQGGAMASTISFPMLAPLLLGTGQYCCKHIHTSSTIFSTGTCSVSDSIDLEVQWTECGLVQSILTWLIQENAVYSPGY
jgi:hypothetical protein